MFRFARLFCIPILTVLLLPAAAAAQAVDQIASAKKIETPLVEEIDFHGTDFSTQTRLGLANSTGNTRSLTITGGNDTKYRYHRFENRWRAGAYYERIFAKTNSTAAGTQARYIYGTYRLDVYLKQYFSVYVGGGGYSDEIKGIDLGGQGFGGVRFFVIRRPETLLALSFGYDFTWEDRVAPTPDKKINSATQLVEFQQKLNSIVTFQQRAESLVNVKDGYDTRVNSRTAIDVKLAKHLSLLVAFELRLDNRPVPGYKKLDTLTDVSLEVTF